MQINGCCCHVQLISCGLLSVGHGAVTLNRAVRCFATVLHIGKTYSVTATAPVPLALRCFGAVGIAISIILFGWRFVPMSGQFLICISMQQEL